MGLSQIVSLPRAAKTYWATVNFQIKARDLLLILNSEEEAQMAAEQAGFFLPKQKILWLPAYDSLTALTADPYIAAARAKVLAALSIHNRHPYLILASLSSCIHKVESAKVFQNQLSTISTGQDISPDELAGSLVRLSFKLNSTPTGPGEFAIRGEIMDIILPDYVGYRLNFSWGKLTSIKLLDLDSNLSTDSVNELVLYPISEMVKSEQSDQNTCSLIEYLVNPILVIDTLYKSYLKDCWLEIVNDYQAQPMEQEGLSAAGSRLFTEREVEQWSNNYETYFYNADGEGLIKLIPSLHQQSLKASIPVFMLLRELVAHYKKKKIIIGCNSKNSVAPIQNLATSAELHCKEIEQSTQAGYHRLNLAILPLTESFYDQDYLFISQSDLTGIQTTYNQQKVTNNRRKLKNILAELSTFVLEELVVHTDYGIGKFLGVVTLQIGNQAHDCLKLLYANDDKLYVPIENIDAVKKYGVEDAPLDRLGSVAWQKRKATLKDRLNLIAHQLIHTAASRKAINNQLIDLNSFSYEQFCGQFPYLETEDQLTAARAIQADLISDKITERLICGDVGFGKTELAMRAAFIATAGNLNKRLQVAIIVPTTILCRQHYLNFSRRFSGFGVNIAELSRLSSSASQKSTKQGIASHEIDIVIGTHALLSKEVSFANLGLIIIDEEQHFGVAQKEHLKKLKHNVHVISLSATPIPRSLHMSLMGIKELSIIATPPLNRLAIKTSVLEYNSGTIKNILMQEKGRNGRSFYVLPRLQLLEAAYESLKQLVPKLVIKVAHGKLPAKALDEIMGDFYHGKFDVLLCTPIIESGIDIPEANTIIIDHAQMLGLSQLYQLRGRVGRSTTKGYAYLILNGSKKFTKQAYARLELMQHVDQLGAGFAIATHDMDSRGFGNLIGEEQSGHIREVGVELYQDMLEEAIMMHQGQATVDNKVNSAINLGLPVYIPHEYVTDHNTRLSLYRQIGELNNMEEVEQLKKALTDRYGPYPIEVENLLAIVKVKQLCRQLQISALDSGPKGFAIKFTDEPFNAQLMVMAIREVFAKNGKISASSKLVIIKELDHNSVLEETNKMLNKLLDLKHRLLKAQKVAS